MKPQLKLVDANTNLSTTKNTQSIELQEGVFIRKREIGSNWQIRIVVKGKKDVRLSTGTADVEKAKEVCLTKLAEINYRLANNYTIHKKSFDEIANDFLIDVKKSERRTCWRPFAPEITIRAGGESGRTAAIVPCCQTLGPPNEEKSILGYMDKDTFETIYNGKEYKKLREAHKSKDFDSIDYCKNCDFLYDDPEVLVWSNDPTAKINHMLGTDEDFILTKYTK